MPKPRRRRQAAFFLLAVLTLSAGCSRQPAPAPQKETAKGYVIGLGEIMGLTQMRHAKLWFAGRAGNWPLAAYELDELKEGFDDAVAYHPRHPGVPEPLAAMIPRYVGPPLHELEAAVAAKNGPRFTAAFDDLTAGCNACHKAAGFGFNRLQRPTAPPFSNQIFMPETPGPKHG